MHIGTKKGNRGLLMLIPLLAVSLWMTLCPLFGNTSIKLKWSISIYLITELMLEIKHYCVQRRDCARGGKVNWMWHKVFASHILLIEFYFWPLRPEETDISVFKIKCKHRGFCVKCGICRMCEREFVHCCKASVLGNIYQCHLKGIQYGDVLFHLDQSLGKVCISIIVTHS